MAEETKYTIGSVYVVGSSVPDLVGGESSHGADIDVVFFTEEDIPRGEPILPAEPLIELTGGLVRDFKTSIGCYSNGVPVKPRGEILLDAVPARMSDVDNQSPHVVIDMCMRDNVHVQGREVLGALLNVEMSPEMVIARMS